MRGRRLTVPVALAGLRTPARSQVAGADAVSVPCDVGFPDAGESALSKVTLIEPARVQRWETLGLKRRLDIAGPSHPGPPPAQAPLMRSVHLVRDPARPRGASGAITSTRGP